MVSTAIGAKIKRTFKKYIYSLTLSSFMLGREIRRCGHNSFNRTRTTFWKIPGK